VTGPAVVAQSLLVEHASVEAIHILRRAGIRAILIKGPPMQGWLRPAGAPRPSVDVDVLVDPSDIEAAVDAFLARGYAVDPEVTPGVEHHAVPLTAAGRIPVELHWTLWNTDASSTWQAQEDETETVPLLGALVDVPNEAARCLIVALHAAHHGTGETAPVYDLERAIAVAGHHAWERASELAFRVDGERAFAAGLGLVPTGMQIRGSLGLTALPLTERLALNLNDPLVPGAPAYHALAYQRGVVARGRFVVRKLFPPASFMRLKYPVAQSGRTGLVLAYAYRLLWMIRWAVPGLRAWRRARKAAATSGGPHE